MAEVTKQMLHDLALEIDRQLSELGTDMDEITREMKSLNADLAAMGRDIHNIHGILGRHDDRLERIKRRLELRELAEPQHPFRPHP